MNQKLTKGGHTSHLPLHTSNRGITLIALVITIIVLLILAGVTINMVLGDDGIIANAQAAKKAQDDANKDDLLAKAKGEAKLANYIKQTPMSDADLNKALGKTGENVIENNTTVAKVVDGVPIPVGFSYVQGTIKDEGLIVVDGYGNEFVWVPVDEVLESGSVNYEDDKVCLIHDDNDTAISWGWDWDFDETKATKDYEEMKTSVSTYGGFYVGRYETSWTGSRVASVGNVTAMSDDCETYNGGPDWNTFYTEQKKLHEKSSSVVSGMIYGSQWDAIMDWMSDVVNPYALDPDNNLYINDSTNMGHYCYIACDKCLGIGYTDESYSVLCDFCYYGSVSTCEKVEPIETGSNSEYSVKNIFDLAGNYLEYTCENWEPDGPVRRGGGYQGEGKEYCASFRCDMTDSYSLSSSRIQLYIK